MRIGVCCFSDIDDAEEGWASVSGEEAYSVEDYSELPSNIIWVVNLPFPKYSALNLKSAPHIYDTQYFRTSISQIANETGLSGDNKKLSEFCSLVFSEIIGYTNNRIGISLENPGYRFHKLLSYRMIPDFARKKPEGKNNRDIFQAIEQGTQGNQAMSGVKKPHDSSAVTFVFPRTPYAKWITTQKYPGEGFWKEVKQKNESAVFGWEDGKYLKSTKAVSERLIDLGEKNALLLRVNIHSIDSSYKSFATFGSGYRNGVRHWASLPEVLEISNYSKVEISGGYMTPYYQDSLIDDSVIDSQSPSYAHGLFSENIWASLCSPISNGRSQSETPLSCYMRSYDRIICSRAAKSFADDGFIIGSYSMGRIVVFIRPGEEARAAEKALSIGMIPPVEYLNNKGFSV